MASLRDNIIIVIIMIIRKFILADKVCWRINNFEICFKASTCFYLMLLFVVVVVVCSEFVVCFIIV